MTEQFIVTATGTKDGTEYSTLTRVVSGAKKNGDTYAFLDANRTIRETKALPFGATYQYDTVPVNVKA